VHGAHCGQLPPCHVARLPSHFVDRRGILPRRKVDLTPSGGEAQPWRRDGGRGLRPFGSSVDDFLQMALHGDRVAILGKGSWKGSLAFSIPASAGPRPSCLGCRVGPAMQRGRNPPKLFAVRCYPVPQRSMGVARSLGLQAIVNFPYSQEVVTALTETFTTQKRGFGNSQWTKYSLPISQQICR
jgi:hypothetical protein